MEVGSPMFIVGNSFKSYLFPLVNSFFYFTCREMLVEGIKFSQQFCSKGPREHFMLD